MAEYNYLAKGLGLQYVVRGRLPQPLHPPHRAPPGWAATSSRTRLIDGVVVVGCGRLDNGEQMGGAGIGIGIGGWGDVERLTIANCTALGQRHQRHLPGAAEGLLDAAARLPDHRLPQPGQPLRHLRLGRRRADRLGLHDDRQPGGRLRRVGATAPSSVAGRGGLLTDCVIDGNVGDGVSIGNTPGPYTVRGNRISGNGRYGYHAARPRARLPGPGAGRGDREQRVLGQRPGRDPDRPPDDRRGAAQQPDPQQRPAVRRGAPAVAATPSATASGPGRPVGELAARRPPGQGAAGRQGASPWWPPTPPPNSPSPRSARTPSPRGAGTPRCPAPAYELPAAPPTRAGITINAAVRLGHRPGQPDLGQPRRADPDPRAVDHRPGQLRGLPGRGQRPGRQRRRRPSGWTPRRSVGGGTATTATRTGTDDPVPARRGRSPDIGCTPDPVRHRRGQ